MRTLQEKYNGIQEGKFSKEHFLAEARMQQPQLITRFNGYDDAVQILKNKGMIQEAINYDNLTQHSDRDLESLINVKKKEREKFNLSKDTPPAARSQDKELGAQISKIERELNSRKSQLKKETVKEAKLTKKSLTDYRYKPTNDMDKYPYEQILRGIRVELEVLGVHGTPTAEEYTKALAKVSKNLEKDSIFYTNQLAGVNPKVDLHDKMVDATAKNTVDTFNGMKKAELKEGFKKLIKKVLSEDAGIASRGVEHGQKNSDEYEFYSDPENYKDEDEVYEMQGGNSDVDYKNELSDYLEDNQIYGYTNKIHDIMTGPSEDEASADLQKFLDDNQIYGYNRGIERIYADYPYDQHWQNQPDGGEVSESKMGDLYAIAQDSNSLRDFLIAVKKEHPETNLRRDIEELKHIWDNRGEDESLGEIQSLSELLK